MRFELVNLRNGTYFLGGVMQTLVQVSSGSGQTSQNEGMGHILS